jgi:putative redox protein
MPSKKLYFKGKKQNRLSALLDLPAESDPVAYALFAHCFTCTKNLKSASYISRALTSSGIAVLRFDFTGLGESEGEFAETNFSSNIDDLIAAADFMAAEHKAPTILIGHSLGGAAVLQAAANIPQSRAVVTIGAPADPGHVMHLLQDKKEVIEKKGAADVLLDGRKFTIKKQFLDDLEAVHMADIIRNLKKAILVLHSPLDETVGVDNAAKIFQMARHPKSFVSLDRANHLLMNEADARYAGALIAVWAQRYIA